MSKLMWSLAALVLFLLALPVLSLGTARNAPMAWWIGLALVGAAGVIPPALRYLGNDGAEAESAATESEDAQSEATQSEATQSEATQSEATQSEATRSKDRQPDGTDFESRAPTTPGRESPPADENQGGGPVNRYRNSRLPEEES